MQSRGKQRQSGLQEKGNGRWRQAEAGKRQTEGRQRQTGR
jgi:hypothetical protein